jgi:hypothetical protein
MDGWNAAARRVAFFLDDDAAEYLTPRKGALSTDTWQAVAEIGRNLVLTRCILLPLLFAVILAGQCYFVLYPGQANDFLPRDTGAWHVRASHILWERAPLMARALGGRAGHPDVYLDYLERQSDRVARCTGGRCAADAPLRGAIQQYSVRIIVERYPELLDLYLCWPRSRRRPPSTLQPSPRLVGAG